jgi:hypothetical protein
MLDREVDDACFACRTGEKLKVGITAVQIDVAGVGRRLRCSYAPDGWISISVMILVMRVDYSSLFLLFG